MNQSLKKFKDYYLTKVLDILWDAWISIGISGHSKFRFHYFIDPESLLLASCFFARYDSRLFDEMMDWLFKHGSLINIQRLNTIIKQIKYFNLAILSGVSEHLSQDYRFRKWKNLSKFKSDSPLENLFINLTEMNVRQYNEPDKIFKEFGFLRGELKLSYKTGEIPVLDPACLIFNLRYLFGINARSEIFLYLLSHEKTHPTELSREIFYSQKNIQDTLVEMSKSGLVNISISNRSKYYGLNREDWKSLFPSDTKIKWLNFSILFHILEKTWIVLDKISPDTSDLLLISSQLKKLMLELKPKLNQIGLGIYFLNNEKVFGEAYFEYFIKNMKKTLNRISKNQESS